MENEKLKNIHCNRKISELDQDHREGEEYQGLEENLSIVRINQCHRSGLYRKEGEMKQSQTIERPY